MGVNKHFVVFYGGPYSLEKQAEGIAVNQAVIYGYCEKCGCLKRCASDTTFHPPFFTWCMRKKAEIIASLKTGGDGQ